jgi:opacity protein-like surface antigen
MQRRRTPHRRLAGAVASVSLLALLTTAGRALADPAPTSPEQGFDLGEIEGARALAMGGAQNALGTSTGALYQNPANLAMARVYHFEGIATLAPQARRQSYGGAVVDSVTNKLAGGFAGTWNTLDPDGLRRTWTDLRLGLAYPVSDRISLGATGRYLRANQAVASGPLGASLASDGTSGQALFDGLTFDAGITVVPAQSIRLGLVGHNLTNPGSGLVPTTLAGGIGFLFGDLAAELGGLADFSTYSRTRARLNAGLEYFAAGHFPLRIGYRYDEGQKAHSGSAGLGYVDRKWSFEISLRHEFTDASSTFITAALRFFYDAGHGGAQDEPDPM